jgi:hypothetical protein
MTTRRVLFGPLEDVMRAGLLPGFRHRFDVVESSRTGRQLIDEAQALGCAALVMRRHDLARLVTWPPTVLCLGVASAASDVLVVKAGMLSQYPDPSPSALCQIISEVVDS